MEHRKKHCLLALCADRRGNGAMVQLPVGTAEPGSWVRLTGGGFVKVQEVVVTEPGGMVCRALESRYPLLSAGEVLAPVWKGAGCD